MWRCTATERPVMPLEFTVRNVSRTATLLEHRRSGYIDNNILNFVYGSYYVKLNSYNTGAEDREVLQMFAKKMEENLEEKGGLPSLLSAFPSEGKKRQFREIYHEEFSGIHFFQFRLYR